MMEKTLRTSILLKILFAIVIVQGLVAVSIAGLTAFLYSTKTTDVISTYKQNAQAANGPDLNKLQPINDVHKQMMDMNKDSLSKRKDSAHKKNLTNRFNQTTEKKCLHNLLQSLSKKRVHAENPQLKRRLQIITTTNWDFVDITDNWLESIRRLGLRYNISLVCEDKQAYTYFKRRANSEFQVLYTKNFKMADVLRRGSTFQDLILKRIVYTRELLKTGVNVLLADVDAVWLKDPIAFIMDEYDEFDVWLARGKTEDIPCPCFMYMKSNHAVSDLISSWVSRILDDKKKTDQERGGKHVTDQWALQPLLEEAEEKGLVTVKRLEKKYFPTGDLYFDKKWNRKYKSQVFIAHGNHQGRHDGKKSAFKHFGLWLLYE